MQKYAQDGELFPEFIFTELKPGTTYNIEVRGVFVVDDEKTRSPAGIVRKRTGECGKFPSNYAACRLKLHLSMTAF